MKNKTLAQIREETKSNYTFDDFPVGTRVEIVTPMEDFTPFFNEKGIVINNRHSYLGIKVQLDEPRHYTDGYIEIFNFNPESLKPIEVNFNKALRNVSFGSMV